MNRKAKGTQGERKLVNAFNLANWGAIRVAGSGSTKWPAPDLLVGNGKRQFAIECKMTSRNTKYFPKEEIKQLRLFAKNFGATPIIAVKFEKYDWLFVHISTLEKTPKSYVLTLQNAYNNGLTIHKFINNAHKV